MKRIGTFTKRKQELFPLVAKGHEIARGRCGRSMEVISAAATAVMGLSAVLMPSATHAATYSWLGNSSANFDDSGNWSGTSPKTIPTYGDTLVFDAAGTAGATLNNNFAPDIFLGAITFNADSSAYTINGTEFTLNGTLTNSSANLQTFNTNIVTNQGVRTIALTNGGGNVTFNGTVNGNGTGLNLTGTGTVTLNAADLMTGTTTIGDTTTLALSNAGAIQSGLVTDNAITSGGLSFTSGIGSFSIGGLAGAGNIALTDTASANVTLSIGNNGSPNIAANSTSNTYSGNLSGGGSIIKNGTGTLTLSGSANSFTGGTTITRGGITLSNGSFASPSLTLGGSGGGTLTVSNGTNGVGFTSGTTLNTGASFLVATASTGTVNLGAITRNAGTSLDIALSTGGGTVTTSTANTASTILGGWATVSGANWAVNNAGTIVALATYDTTNTYPSGADVNATAAASPAGFTVNSLLMSTSSVALTPTGTNVITSGGILVPSGVTNAQITGGTLSAASGQDLIVNEFGAGPFTIGSAIVNNGTATGLTKGGSGGSLILTGANSYTGTTTINTGTVQIGNGGTTATLGAGNVVNNAALAFNRTDAAATPCVVANNISGLGSLTVNTGAVTLTSSNTYLGGTTIANAASAILILGNANAVKNSTVTNSNTTTANALAFASGIGTFNLSNGIAGGGAFALTDSASQPVI